MQIDTWPAEDLKSWDRYRRFHWGLTSLGARRTERWAGQQTPFTLFDSGEMVCELSCPAPPQRGRYPALNAAIYMTTDKNLPRLCTPEGEELASCWLSSPRSQHLLVDCTSGRAVRIDPQLLDPARRETLPGAILKLLAAGHDKPGSCMIHGAYIPAQGAPPIGNPVTVGKPWTKGCDKHQCAHIKAMIRAQRMAVNTGCVSAPKLFLQADPRKLCEVDYFQQLDEPTQGGLWRKIIGPWLEIHPYLIIS